MRDKEGGDGGSSPLEEFYGLPESEPLAKPANEEAQGRKKCTDFEEILSATGGDGKFQKVLLYFIICPIITVSPFLVLNGIFMLDIPDHWCHIPPPTDGILTTPHNLSLEEWKDMHLPIETGPDGSSRHSQCFMYDPADVSLPLENRSTIGCPSGWDYDKTDYDSTIPSDYNWVCDHVEYATATFTWTGFGSAVGTIIFGILADKLGRKPIFFATCVVIVVFRAMSLFVPQHLWAYLALQFLSGTAFPAFFSMPSLLMAEVCSAEYRSWTYAVVWMIWVVGNSFLPLVAWLSRGWFLLGVLSALPGLLLFGYYPFMYESPRWLITKGKGQEAFKIVKKIAQMNRAKIDDIQIQQMISDLIQKQKEEELNKNIGVWTLFQKYRLAKNTIFLCIAWSMNCLLYYGITLNTTSMAGNKFLNYFLLSIIELPSGYLAGVLVEKTGRRWTQAGFFMLCVVSCAICAIAVVQPEWSTIGVVVGALGIKFGVTITSLVAYLQGAEIFPTVLRSTGSGLASTISSIIGIGGPYIVFTGKINAAMPYIVLGILSALGVLSSMSLPETFQQHLPETIEDANRFGKGIKFWSYLPIDNRKKSNNNDNETTTKEKKLSI